MTALLAAAPDRVFRLVVSADPFGTRIEARDVVVGPSLAELVAAEVAAGGRMVGHAVVMVDGARIADRDWPDLRPEGRQLVAINLLPAGANGGRMGLQGASALFALAALIPSPASPFLAAAAIATAVAANLAFPPPSQKFSKNDAESAVYRVGPARNDGKPWAVVPMLFGQMRFTPPAAVKPYTQLIGQTDTWQTVLALSSGMVRLDRVYVGGVEYQALGSSIEIELRRGWHPSRIADKGAWTTLASGQFPDPLAVAGDHYTAAIAGTVAGRAVAAGDTVTCNGLADPAASWDAWDLNQFQPLRLYGKAIDQQTPGAQLDQGVGHTRTTPANTTRIGIEVTFFYGLYHVQNAPPGKLADKTATFSIEVAPAGSGTWGTVNGNWVVTDRRPTTFAVGYGFDVPAGAWDVRLTRANFVSHDDARNFDKATWTLLTAYTADDAVPLDAGIAYLAMRGRRNANTDTVEVVATAMAPAPTDVPGAWALAPTRSLAAAYRAVLQHPLSPDPLADDEIDVTRLEDWHAWTGERGWTYDAYHDSEADVEDTLSELAKCGRASPGFRDGLRSLVIDRPQPSAVQMITPLNSWGYRFEFRYPDAVHGYRVSYADAEQDWKIEDTRVVYADGYDAASARDVRRLDWVGLTGWAQVHALTRYHLAQQLYRRETHFAYQDWESLTIERGARVRLAHDVLKVGLGGGRITEVQIDAGLAVAVTLDQPVRLDPSVTRWGMRVRQVRGQQVSDAVYAVTPIADAEAVQAIGWAFDAPAAVLSGATVLDRWEFSGTLYGTWYGTLPASSSGIAYGAAGLIVDAATEAAWAIPGDPLEQVEAMLAWRPASGSASVGLLSFAAAGAERLELRYDAVAKAFAVHDESAALVVRTYLALSAGTEYTVTLRQSASQITLQVTDGVIDVSEVASRPPAAPMIVMAIAADAVDRGSYGLLVLSDAARPVVDATVPVAGELAVFGPRGAESFDALVVSVSPTGGHAAEIAMVPYSDGVYSADTEPVPVFDPVARVETLAAPDVIEVLSGNGVMAVTPSGGLIPRVLFRLRASRIPDVALVVLLRQSGTTQPFQQAAVLLTAPGEAWIGGVEEGVTYDFRLHYSHPDYRPSPEALISAHLVIGSADTPVAVEGLTVTVAGGIATLRWSAATDADVLRGGRIEVRHSSLTTGASAANSYTLGAALPPSAVIAHVPAMEGTYFVVAVDSGGRYGDAAAVVLSRLASPFAWAALDDGIEDPAFAGIKTNMVAAGGVLKLAVSDGRAAEAGSYQWANPIDLGAVLRGRLRVEIEFVVAEESDAWDDDTPWDSPSEAWDGGVAGVTGCDVTVYARFSDDDPAGAPTWGPWQRADQSDFAARAIDLKAEVISEGNTVNVNIDRLRAYAEAVTP